MSPDDDFRDELRSRLIEHPPPGTGIAATPEEADVLHEWQRTPHSGGERILGLPREPKGTVAR